MNHIEEQQYLNKLGRRIKQLREEKGLTQSNCGVDERTIRRIENEREVFNPSYLTLVEISIGLDVQLQELLTFE